MTRSLPPVHRRAPAIRPRQPQAAEPQDTLEASEQHLDTFAIATGLLKASVFASARAASRAPSLSPYASMRRACPYRREPWTRHG
jgi:hypothetical protein